nr:hypothetical protein [Ruegeria lacuscaerulensis]
MNPDFEFTFYVPEFLCSDSLKGSYQRAIKVQMNRLGNGNATGRRNAFKPRSNVHSIAKYIVSFLCNVTYMNADTQFQDRLFGQVFLYLNRSSYGLCRTVEPRQPTVAHAFDDPTCLARNCRRYDVAFQMVKHHYCGLFVFVH